MIGSVIGAICCLLCALPFYYVSYFGKNDSTPIAFWSGDESLDSRIKDVDVYNLKMSKLYKYYAHSYLLIGLMLFVFFKFAIGWLIFNCTGGLYLVWYWYQKYVHEYEVK